MDREDLGRSPLQIDKPTDFSLLSIREIHDELDLPIEATPDLTGSENHPDVYGGGQVVGSFAREWHGERRPILLKALFQPQWASWHLGSSLVVSILGRNLGSLPRFQPLSQPAFSLFSTHDRIET